MPIELPVLARKTTLKLLWSGAALSLLISFLLGVRNGELRGNFAFGLFIAAIVFDLVIVLTYSEGYVTRRFTKLGWFALCLLVLAFTVSLEQFSPKSGSDTVLIYVGLLLSFPIGLVVAPIASLSADTLFRNNEYGQLIFIWVCFIGAGYLQWFVFLPKKMTKLRNNHTT